MVTMSEIRKKNLLTIVEMMPGTYQLEGGGVTNLLNHWVAHAKEKGYEGLEVKERECTLSYKLFEDEK